MDLKKKKKEKKEKSKINVFSLEVFSLFSNSHPHCTDQKVQYKFAVAPKKTKAYCKNVLKYQL